MPQNKKQDLSPTPVKKALPANLSSNIAALTCLVVLPMLATDVYLPALPQVAAMLGTDHATVMQTLTAYMAGYALSLMIAGVASDRYGRRVVIMTGVSLFCISSLACAVADSISMLITFRFLQALGGGCGTLLARVVVRDMFDYTNQVRVLSYLSAGLALSPTLGPILGGYLATHFGWRAPFVFITAFSCVACLATFVVLKESNPAENRQRISVLSVIKQYGLLFRHRVFVSYTLIISLAWAVYFSFLASSSFLLQKIFGLSPVAYGFAFALVIAGYVGGTIVTRRQIGRRSINGMIRGASIAMLGATCLLLVASWLAPANLLLMLCLVSVSLAGVGVIFPTTQAAVMQPFASNVGLVAGLFYATEMFFGAITSWTLGSLRDSTAQPMAMVMAVSALLLFCIVRYMLPEPQVGNAQERKAAVELTPAVEAD